MPTYFTNIYYLGEEAQAKIDEIKKLCDSDFSEKEFTNFGENTKLIRIGSFAGVSFVDGGTDMNSLQGNCVTYGLA